MIPDNGPRAGLIPFSLPLLCLATFSPFQQTDTRPRDPDADLRLAAYWGFDVVVLLNEPALRSDLSVSPDQVVKHNQLVDQYLVSLKALHLAATKTQDLPPQKRDATLEELGRQQRQLTDRFGKRATDILTLAQRTRLKEITFQLRGVDAFFTEEIGTRISLDDRQLKEIRQIRSWLVGEIRRLYEPDRSKTTDLSDDSAGLVQLRAQAQRRITALLRNDQLDQVKQLRGRPIDFSRTDLSMTLRQRREVGNTRGDKP